MSNNISKKVLLILLACKVLMIAACQSTPYKPVVIEKNNLEQKIMQPADQQFPEISEKWSETLSFQGGVQVVIEADIKKPDVAAYPVLETKPHEFSQGEVQTFADYFMKGQPLYKNEQIRVKADVENDIVIVQSYLDKVKTKKYSSEAGRQADIDMYSEILAQLKEEYSNVPEREPEPETTKYMF